MANGEFAKYVFNNFNPVEDTMGYKVPEDEGRSTTYVFHPDWHKADFTNMWNKVEYLYQPAPAVGASKRFVASKNSETAEAGDEIFVQTPYCHPEADKAIMFFSTDPKQGNKLGGEVEFWIGAGADAERYTLDSVGVIYIPAGVYHGPYRLLRIDDPKHPIAMFSTLLTKEVSGDIKLALDGEGNPILPADLDAPPQDENGKYAKYVFKNMPTSEEAMNYHIPHYENKNRVWVFDEMWHKADFHKLWVEADMHMNHGAWVGGGARAYVTEDGPAMNGLDLKKGDYMMTLGPHKHNCDEIFMIMGTDPSKPGKLGGEYTFWLGTGDEAESFTFDTNTCVYCPAGVNHNPHGTLRLDNPDYPIMVFIALLSPGHYGDTSVYPYDENGKLIYPPGFVEHP